MKAGHERLLDRSCVKGSPIFYDPLFFEISRRSLMILHNWRTHTVQVLFAV